MWQHTTRHSTNLCIHLRTTTKRRHITSHSMPRGFLSLPFPFPLPLSLSLSFSEVSLTVYIYCMYTTLTISDRIGNVITLFLRVGVVRSLHFLGKAIQPRHCIFVVLVPNCSTFEWVLGGLFYIESLHYFLVTSHVNMSAFRSLCALFSFSLGSCYYRLIHVHVRSREFCQQQQNKTPFLFRDHRTGVKMQTTKWYW